MSSLGSVNGKYFPKLQQNQSTFTAANADGRGAPFLLMKFENSFPVGTNNDDNT